MFWNKRNQINQIEWHEMPGCFERHLQRRYNNPLFPLGRRTVSSEELKEARKKDSNDLKEFIKQFTLWLSGSAKLNDKSAINDLSHCLQDTQYLAELAFAVGGDLGEEISTLDGMEDRITAFMNMRLPQGAELLKSAHDLSATRRNSYFAQVSMYYPDDYSGSRRRKDTPILESEQLAALLSEDMGTIAVAGLLSRSFPRYRPNSDDVNELLDKAVRDGLDMQYAKEVADAFCKLKGVTKE